MIHGRLVPVLGAVTLVAAGVAGCSTDLATVPAPSASSAACAALLARLPDRLGDLGRRHVTGAGTAAWGDPPIGLFCGVPEPGPTTDACISVGDADGANLIDWIALPESEDGSAQFVTYGRTPAVEVTVPARIAGDQPTGHLVDLAAAIAPMPQTAHCT